MCDSNIDQTLTSEKDGNERNDLEMNKGKLNVNVNKGKLNVNGNESHRASYAREERREFDLDGLRGPRHLSNWLEMARYFSFASLKVSRFPLELSTVPR